VTSDTQAALDTDECKSPFGGTLWGIGRSLSAEHAELWGGLLDVTSQATADGVAERLIGEVETGAPDDQIALRDGKRYVARLERRPRRRNTGGEYRARADATHLVTGGLGGMGLAMARWLVERGARHLLLLGRTPVPAREAWAGLGSDTSPVGRRVAAVVALEAMGARVETAAIDVAAEGILEGCLEARRARGEPPVRGVIHAAGVVQFQALSTQEIGAVRTAVAAKIEGAWRLHRIFVDPPLDSLVLCSSSSALLRSPLLGAYAGGNAFLDALAHHRRSRGLAALSVNWGTWGEVGMAAEAGRAKGGGLLSGMTTISTSQGLAALGDLLATGAVQAAVMPVDWAALARAYATFARDRFLASLVGEGGTTEVGRSASAGALAALRAAPSAGRGDLLAAYLRAEAARTLGMASDDLDLASPLSSLGFDSLMAVQLKNQIEADLGVVVPMIRFLDGPSVNQLAPSVLLAIGADLPNFPLAEVAGAEAYEEGFI
jgi:short-subunit dehydrogenase/acyl carrier protein